MPSFAFWITKRKTMSNKIVKSLPAPIQFVADSWSRARAHLRSQYREKQESIANMQLSIRDRDMKHKIETRKLQDKIESNERLIKSLREQLNKSEEKVSGLEMQLRFANQPNYIASVQNDKGTEAAQESK